ncbi:MAG TPA: fumarylacetoacetate hydrolase family protein, partial [Symbiobacteriaceae bacterium]|nr:fumarylacetoacetate hydrolase family protein [Symbiobacteriaceae bacterium]
MKLVTFLAPGHTVPMAGWLDGNLVFAAREKSMEDLIRGERGVAGEAWQVEQVTLLAPLPRPRTIRDFYAFEAHVKNARSRRGLGMIPEWYQFPVFYFSNPNAVCGQGAAVPRPRATHMLDFELEVAAVIGRE